MFCAYVNSSNIHAKIYIQLTGHYNWYWLKTINYPAGIIRADEYTLIFDNKFNPIKHGSRGDGDYIYVFQRPRPIAKYNVGGGGTDNGSKNNLDECYSYKSPSATITDTTVVNIDNPKNESIVERGLRGVHSDGSVRETSSLELEWTGVESGSEGENADGTNWSTILPQGTGEYELTATVPHDVKKIKYTVVLKPALTPYTIEDIQLLKTFKWGGYAKSPEAQLVDKLAREAGLVNLGDDFSDNNIGSVVTDRVQFFAGGASGDYNIFYSGSGTKKFIEKKVDKLFGKHLPFETKASLIDKILAKKSACFINSTDEFHTAMKNTMDIFFAENSVGRTISEMDIPLGVNPTMMIVMDAAKTVVNIKLNYELASETSGAPQLLQNKAKIELFDIVAIEVVGAVAGGVVVKAGSKAFKVIKSFFKKFNFKFTKSQKPQISPDGRVIPYGKTAAESKAIRIPRGAKKGEFFEINGQKAFYDKDGFIKLDSKFDTTIGKNNFGSRNDGQHFKAANENLRAALKKDPKLAKKMGLTKAQKDFLDKDPAVQDPPPGLTWHHHQDAGKMQLVTKEPHGSFRHTGGMAIWGGGYK